MNKEKKFDIFFAREEKNMHSTLFQPFKLRVHDVENVPEDGVRNEHTASRQAHVSVAEPYQAFLVKRVHEGFIVPLWEG
jgi:hypothetical protein